MYVCMYADLRGMASSGYWVTMCGRSMPMVHTVGRNLRFAHAHVHTAGRNQSMYMQLSGIDLQFCFHTRTRAALTLAPPQLKEPSWRRFSTCAPWRGSMLHVVTFTLGEEATLEEATLGEEGATLQCQPCMQPPPLAPLCSNMHFHVLPLGC